MVTPFYFGSSSRQLYGSYHPPGRVAVRDCAVLICAPIAQEYMRSHWALRRLADQLADSGFHVLRFDYSCTGDSVGEFDDARVHYWLDDIVAAGEEILNISGLSSLSIVGLRFGSTLAASASLADIFRVKDLVLWDPVVSGDDYLNKLGSLHYEQYFVQSGGRSTSGYREILGFLFSSHLEKDIRSMSLLECDGVAAERVFTFSTMEGHEFIDLHQYLLSRVGYAKHEEVDEPGEWLRVDCVESALLGKKVSDRIVQRLLNND